MPVPTRVGFLADGWGVGGAIGYGLTAPTLFGLPKTRGREQV
ncbi:hypothetical protein [Streptomyces sp. CC219B]|nr:hypothetical protein [Streptomyces sp. CC219B]